MTCAAPQVRREPFAAAGGGRWARSRRGAREPRPLPSPGRAPATTSCPARARAQWRARSRPAPRCPQGRPLPTARRRGAGRPTLLVRGRARGSRAGGRRGGLRSSRTRPPRAGSGRLPPPRGPLPMPPARPRTARAGRSGHCAGRRAPGRSCHPGCGRTGSPRGGGRAPAHRAGPRRGASRRGNSASRSAPAGRMRRRPRTRPARSAPWRMPAADSTLPRRLISLSRLSAYQISARGSSIAKMPVTPKRAVNG